MELELHGIGKLSENSRDDVASQIDVPPNPAEHESGVSSQVGRAAGAPCLLVRSVRIERGPSESGDQW